MPDRLRLPPAAPLSMQLVERPPVRQEVREQLRLGVERRQLGRGVALVFA